MESDERRPSRQLAELLADCLQIPAGERAQFVQFARQTESTVAASLPAVAPPTDGDDRSVSLEPPPAPHHNLPMPLTSCVGRDSVLDDLTRRLRDRAARPLTLTGAGGSGKTRLALEVAIDAAAELTDLLPDGVWWVDLAPIEDETLVSPAVNRALGLVEAAEQPVEETLAAFLADKRLLLVLDNCEHLVAAVARLVERLLRRCPDIQMLATSREALGVPGEFVYQVPTLALPDPNADWETQAASAAVRLFVERAVAQRPAFRLTAENTPAVVQICRRLDGIPLALELAAARVRLLSPAQIAGRLDDRFALLTGGARTALPRQQTLRALVDWSYELLEPAERLLLHRLGIFVDGWTLDAAEAVGADESLRAATIIELLGRLVDKSLVQVIESEVEMRYEMLETIRAYAHDRLVESAEIEVIRERHLAYYVAWAEAAERQIYGPEGTEWLQALERDYGNLRVALRWALAAAGDESRHALGVRLATALASFWLRRNYPHEGARWTALALEMMPAATPAEAQGRLFSAAGTMAWLASDLDQATIHHERALFLFRKLDNLARLAEVLSNLAVLQTMRGRMERALVWSETSVELARESGDAWVYGFTLLNLGLAYFHLGQFVPAERILAEAVDVDRAVGDGLSLALALCALVVVSARLGEMEGAQAYMAETLQLAAEVGDVRVEATAWQTWAKVQRLRGEPSAPAFRESLRLFARTTDRLNILESLDELAIEWGRGPACEKAARLLGATEAWRAQLRLARPDDVAAAMDEMIPSLRGALGEAAFDAARRRGGGLTLEEALALALDEPGAGR
jgi:predicted ATPase